MFETYESPVRRKLYQSQRAVVGLNERKIKCPSCGFLLCKAYGHEHCYVSVVCEKCKFNEVIDLALFRTMRLKQFYNEKEGYWYVPSQEEQPA